MAAGFPNPGVKISKFVKQIETHMRLLPLIALLCISTTLFANCAVFDNYILYTTKTARPDVFTVTFVSARHRVGWFGVAFSQNKTMENVLSVVGYVNETGTSIYQMKSNASFHASRVIESEDIMEKRAWERDIEKAFRMFTFEFQVNLSQVVETKFIGFAVNTEQTPTSISNLPFHTKYGYRPIGNISTCMIPHLIL